MELYIGGYAQGKLSYVIKDKNLKDKDIVQGENITHIADISGKKLLNHYHLLVRNQLMNQEEPEKFLEDIFLKYPDLLIICDEVGNGIVPMDAFERDYRERTGRLLCQIASRANRVDRVICGIGQRIK